MKMKSKVFKSISILIASFALLAVNVSLVQSCFIFYHQPKMPDRLKQSNDKK